MPFQISAIHRKLIVRLTLAAILLSTILGISTFFYEQRQMQRQIMEMVQLGIQVYQAEAPHRLEALTEAVQPTMQDMANLARNPPHTDLGRFVFFALYDTDQQEIGHIADGSIVDIPRLRDTLDQLQPGRLLPDQIELGSVLRIGRDHGMPFVVAVANDQGRTVGYVKGVFVASPQTEENIHRTARRASVLAVVFVFVTALFIYPIIRSLIARLEKQAEQLAYANIETIKVLGCAIAKRDSDTDAHNFRVTIYAVHLAEAIGLDSEEMRALIKGAFLHDVGKIGVPDAILRKSGKLTEEEMKVMQGHVRNGLDIIRQADWLADVASVVGCHHEKYDGSGYPNGLAGNAIPLVARIFTIADAFDALTSVRPYKPAYSLDESLRILRAGSGSQFDPELLLIFEALAPSLWAKVSADTNDSAAVLGRLVRPYFEIGAGKFNTESILI